MTAALAGMLCAASAGADPADEPVDTAELLAEGWKELRYANWPKSRELLEQVRTLSTHPEEQAEATFALATLWQHRRPGPDVAQAHTLYEEILASHAATAAAPYARLALARLADTPDSETDRDVPLARKLYEETIELYPGHVAAEEAKLRLALTYIQEAYIPPDAGDAEKRARVDAETRREALATAERMLTEHLQARPDSVLAGPMQMMLGNLHERAGRWAKAVEHWIAADAAGIPGQADRAKLYYSIGQVAEQKLADYALAAKWYQRIVDETLRDAKFYLAKLAAERCREKAGIEGTDAEARGEEGDG